MYDGFTLFDVYTEAWRVHLVRNLLEENGLRVIVDNSNMAQLLPIASMSAHLFVKTEDLEKAKKLVDESLIEEDVDFEQLDELAEKSKYETTYYEKPEDANAVIVKKKMPYALFYFFIANYIILILQIAARVAVMNETKAIEIFRYFLPLNIIIACVHLFYLFIVKTSLNRKHAEDVQSENSDDE